ncbi:hypothetical protein ACIA8R_04420 [Nonomuraea sp. NPDC051191]|uniref:hypothetical protein n=1 Tax=Nonomuraea sp. NPDC051191 TaxID=3364372 RepID=UPI0037B1E51D
MMKTVGIEPMPFVVRAARFVMTLQVAFGLVGLVFLAGAVLAAFAPGPLLLFGVQVTFLLLTGWLMERFGARRTWTLWAAVALELLQVGGAVAVDALDPGLDLERVLFATALGPLPVVVLLLLPPSWRWFSRRDRADTPS